MTESTPKSGHFSIVNTFDVFIQHRGKMKLFIAVGARDWRIVIVIFHVLCDHLLGVEFPLTEIALEECCAVNFLVLRKVAGVAEGFVTKCAFI